MSDLEDKDDEDVAETSSAGAEHPDIDAAHIYVLMNLVYRSSQHDSSIWEDIGKRVFLWK